MKFSTSNIFLLKDFTQHVWWLDDSYLKDKLDGRWYGLIADHLVNRLFDDSSLAQSATEKGYDIIVNSWPYRGIWEVKTYGKSGAQLPPSFTRGTGRTPMTEAEFREWNERLNLRGFIIVDVTKVHLNEVRIRAIEYTSMESSGYFGRVLKELNTNNGPRFFSDITEVVV